VFTFGDVEVEEVAVQHRLHNSCYDSNEVVVILSPVAVDPVEQIEGSVHAEGKQIVRGDALSLAGLGHHEKLGQNCHRLEVDREGPQNLLSKRRK
jgi:hypothetical protein